MPLQGVQLYARLAELIPTEGPIIDKEYMIKRFGVNSLKGAAEESLCPSLNAAEYFPQFLADMVISKNKNGVMAPYHSLFVHPNGIIGDGNFRFHWLRWAGLEFAPINLNYFICDNSDTWAALYPFSKEMGMRGKVATTFHPPRHLPFERDNWWELEARHVLKGKIKQGPPDPTFNLSYEACKERLKE